MPPYPGGVAPAPSPGPAAAGDGYQRGHRSARRPGPLRRLFGRRRDDDAATTLDRAAVQASARTDARTDAGRTDAGRGENPAAVPTYRAHHRGAAPAGRLDADHAAAQEHLAAFRPEAPATPAPLALPAGPGGHGPSGNGSGASGSGAADPKPPARFIPKAPEPPATPDDEGDLLYQVLGGLAMRDLTLVESLLQVVEKLESNEEDAGQLELLFRIDHLATRMRRNSENLLVLAGHDHQSRDLEPIPLLDVARAAISEITDYSRAEISALPDVRIAGVAADDLSHILAELLENATSKSPESATVVIRSERTGDGTMVISVEDSGIGIPADQLAAINARLGRAPVVEPSVTRRMGLYVVGRLAQRHGIRVQLRERPYGGITAHVITPGRLIQAGPEAPPRIARRPAGRPQPVPAAASPGRPVPRPAAAPDEPPRPAAPPAPRFSPADPSTLPRRSPGQSTTASPPPDQSGPLPAAQPLAETTGDHADRIRGDLADFRLGQREAQAAASALPHSNGLPRREPGQNQGPGPAEGPSGTEAGPA
ncbi:MAG TPA: ATP-binding protein [Streptosporangiaceae bacterium]|nr:ATP-binding protein [Streptosporangiaceae bacterium]